MRYTTLDDYIKENIQKPIKLSKDYIAGLIDGEGCFRIGTNNDTVHLCFRISMRRDALPLINSINKTIGGLGSITFANQTYDYSKKGSSAPTRNYPTVHMVVGKYENMLKFIEWMEDVPLFQKKREYEIWRESVLFYTKHKTGCGRGIKIKIWVLDKIREYERQIKGERKYKEINKYNIDNKIEIKRLEKKLDNFIIF